VTFELLMQLLWGTWVLLAAGCVYNVWTYGMFMSREDAATARLRGQRRESVALIVAIKGVTPHTDRFLEAILTQDYPTYRILFAVESERDPAFVRLREYPRLGHPTPDRHSAPGHDRGPFAIEVVVAGESVDTGQKIHNQIAAFKRLRAADRIIAFADADMLCGPHWLSRLTGPLALGIHDLTGGYRWLIPEINTLAAMFASVINASVAVLGGREIYNVLWGGSMALTREAFDRLDVPALFSGSLSDDLHLAHTARRHGLRIGYVRSLLVPSTVRYHWGDFLEFARRQYYLVRHYTPILYGVSLFGTGVYMIGWLTATGAAIWGNPSAWIPWVAVFALDQARALARGRLIRRVFEPEVARRLQQTAVLEHLGTPLYQALHLCIAASVLCMRRVTWAGITYRVRGPRDIEVRREAA